MQISWLQEERRARSLRQVWQDSRRLRRFLHQKIRLVHQDRLTKTEMDLSWEKEQAADAWHITSPAEDGEGAAMAMKLAMREAGVRAEQIDYINAHGTSTHHNDLFETRAIRSALGSAADQVVVNSTKSMIGHLLGAAGGVEFIVCVKSIQDGYIHQTMGTKNVDPECDLNYAVGSPVKKDVNYVLTNSLGFGGHNASLLVKKYED